MASGSPVCRRARRAAATYSGCTSPRASICRQRRRPRRPARPVRASGWPDRSSSATCRAPGPARRWGFHPPARAAGRLDRRRGAPLRAVTTPRRPASSQRIDDTLSACLHGGRDRPAAARVVATSSVVPLVVKMTARSPGRTPSLDVRGNGTGQHDPGRSSLAETIGRSVAPVATTIPLADVPSAPPWSGSDGAPRRRSRGHRCPGRRVALDAGHVEQVRV